MSACAACGHPEVVHGGWARPDGSCGYRGCDCKGYAEPSRSDQLCEVCGFPPYLAPGILHVCDPIHGVPS